MTDPVYTRRLAYLDHMSRVQERMVKERAAFEERCKDAWIIYDSDGSYWCIAYGNRDRDLMLERIMIQQHAEGRAERYLDAVGRDRV